MKVNTDGIRTSKENRIIFTSVTRITDFPKRVLRFTPHPMDDWKSGDYVLCEVTRSGGIDIELTTGRMAPVMEGDLLIGALGVRYATLEATGSWQEAESPDQLNIMTGAGLIGRITSKSLFIPAITHVKYLGHVMLDGQPQTMSDFLPDITPAKYATPSVLIVGTSMSSGKTTSARIITRILKDQGLKVVAAKLSGASRYRDILAMSDAGGDEVFDFVDVGLPSTIVDPKTYLERATLLLTLLQNTHSDVAVIEVGASPLEPYNGDNAIKLLADNVKAVVLCASDPYAVYGVIQAFGIKPDIITGPATNTLGGVDLIKNLCGLNAINLIKEKNIPRAATVLSEKLGLAIQ